MRQAHIAGWIGWALAVSGCGGGKTTTADAGSGTGTGTLGMSSTDDGTGPGTTDATGGGTTAAEPTTGGAAGVPAKYAESCAPTDGPAVEFEVGLAERLCSSDFPDDAPILRITLYQGVTLPPGVYTLDGGKGGVYYDDGMGLRFGNNGTLTIVEEVADGVVGSYAVTLEDDTPLAGEFAALYCPRDVICG